MYSTWRVDELKAELKRRGASLRGRKADLVQRLELYDKNFNFGHVDNEAEDPTMELPEMRTYRDINSGTTLPPLTQMHIRQYFCFADKKLKDAKALYESRFLLVARASTHADFTFVKGSCKKTMKALQYEVDVKFNKNGTPEESHCKCPAGSGTEAKCKHVAVLLYGVQHMVQDKIILLHQVSTQRLQTFHVPKAPFTDSPIAAAKLPRKRLHKNFSPYPIHTINKENYNNRIRNLVLNFSNSTMPLKQLYEPANPYAIVADHQYTSQNSEDEFLRNLHLLDVDDMIVTYIEKKTQGQTNNPEWVSQRKYRLTASKFHTICHLKETSKPSYSKQLLHETAFTSRPTNHGIINESVAFNKYTSMYDLDVRQCGLFIHKERPYLGASPDGLIGPETIIEIKCPYSARNEIISDLSVPYLQRDLDGNLALKKTCPYYYQIQGQLYCSNKLYCNLVIYTYKDMQVIYITRDDDFITEMLQKLDHFYINHFRREILRHYLYNDYDLIKRK